MLTRGGNVYLLPCYCPGCEIANRYPCKRSRYIYLPARTLLSLAHRGVMQVKPTEGEQANYARDERQPRIECLTLYAAPRLTTDGSI